MIPLGLLRDTNHISTDTDGTLVPPGAGGPWTDAGAIGAPHSRVTLSGVGTVGRHTAARHGDTDGILCGSGRRYSRYCRCHRQSALGGGGGGTPQGHLPGSQQPYSSGQQPNIGPLSPTPDPPDASRLHYRENTVTPSLCITRIAAVDYRSHIADVILLYFSK